MFKIIFIFQYLKTTSIQTVYHPYTMNNLNIPNKLHFIKKGVLKKTTNIC